ncbi:LysE family translocator [Vibrio chaetopteri]|uniref:LysE family translocator n=1 Tax=Vibrio chaetopteri TaxID=3016528 RepID=A0AAU8BRK6_9VIBR
MFSDVEFVSYLFVTLLYAFMPGPAMLYSIAQTASGGREVGLMAVFGLHIGGYFHVILTVLGLSTVLLSNPELYSIIQKAGAAYLVILGLQRVFSTSMLRSQGVPVSAYSGRKVFIDSVVVDVLNPKAALFYLAFLPQFVDVEGTFDVWLQMLILGVMTNVLFSSADFLSVLLCAQLQQKLRTNRKWISYCSRWAGSIFIVLGVMAFLRT